MQPWARRGVQAALVTGGMLAVGTGVASNLRASEGRAPQQARSPHAGGDALSFGGDSSATQPIFGRLAGRHRLTRQAPRERQLAGWVIDTAQPGVCDHPGVEPDSAGGDMQVGTPSEGFHRSLSWTGAVSGGDRSPLDRALVVPSDDPATVTSFDEPDGIMELREELLGHGALADLVTPEAVDLTVGRLAEPPSAVYTIPRELVQSALSTVFEPQPPPHEFVPLMVPGEFQERANEVPSFSLDRLTTPYRPYFEDKTVPLFDPIADTGAARIVAALGGSPMPGPPPNPLTSTAPLTTLIRA
jgi:hypothetical protein